VPIARPNDVLCAFGRPDDSGRLYGYMMKCDVW
jgi:hypothetical protein